MSKTDPLAPRLKQALQLCVDFELMYYFAASMILFGSLKQRSGQYYVELAKRGYVALHKVGKRSYAVPTVAGCALLGINRERANPVHGRRHDELTAMACDAAFNCKPPWLPVHYPELCSVFGKTIANTLRNTLHLVSPGGVLHRIYLATAGDTQCCAQIRTKLEKLHPELRKVLGQDYCYLVLVERDGKRLSLARHVSNDPELSPCVVVRRSVTSRSLAAFLRDHRKQIEAASSESPQR